MKRKLLRTALALLLSFACLPAWAAADPPGTPSDEPLAFAFNITGAGSDDIMNLNTGADYASRDALLEKYQFRGNDGITAFRYMGAAYNLKPDDPDDDSFLRGVTPLYLRDGGPSTHELILYSSQRLNPQYFHVNGVTRWEEFTGGHYGSGKGRAGEIFWYRTVIDIPEDTSNFIVVMHQQQIVATWQAKRVSGFDGRAMFPTQLYPVAYEDDEEGNITDFTIEVAGMNLPSRREAYEMPDCTLTDFSGPDNVGKYTLTFHYDGPGEKNLDGWEEGWEDPADGLIWVPLLIHGQPWNYFKEAHLKYDWEEETYLPYLDTESWKEPEEDGTINTWGTPAEMATPYYNIWLGGTLEQESAPLVVADAADVVRYHAVLAWDPGATIACAWYDQDGRMTACDVVDSADITDAVVFQSRSSREVTARVMVLGEGLVPVQSRVQAKTIHLPTVDSGETFLTSEAFPVNEEGYISQEIILNDEPATIQATPFPEEGVVQWRTNRRNIIELSDTQGTACTLRGLSPGRATVKARVGTGEPTVCWVEVSGVTLEDLDLSCNQERGLNYELFGDAGSVTDWTVTSSDADVVQADFPEGERLYAARIRAVGEGSCELAVQGGGYSARCQVNVTG